MDSENFNFPKNFLWGASTSSHQVEGGTTNNWSEWEKENAKRLAEEAKNKWSGQQRKKFPEMFKSENYISGKAADHYNRFEEDFDIAKSLGHNAHRLSLEWARIEPEEGVFDEKEIEHYQKVIDSLRERDIEPLVTIWHWTNPLWVRDTGGWENKKTTDYFVRYVEKITSSLKGVRFWITINEPEIVAGKSYLQGTWPPQKKNPFLYLKATRNLINAHKKSYSVIKKIHPEYQVGIAKNNTYFEAHENKLTNVFAKRLLDRYWNFYFLDKIKEYQDFIGLNYYFHKRIKGFKFNQNDNKEITDMGWEVYPEGLYHVLKSLKKYNKPIYITENGLADIDDKKREVFIKEHLQSTSKAIQEGVDVKGYFYWSLLDNFEWDKGYWPRFGLVEINYETMERKIRPSAYEYKKIIDNNSL